MEPDSPRAKFVKLCEVRWLEVVAGSNSWKPRVIPGKRMIKLDGAELPQSDEIGESFERMTNDGEE